MRRSYLGTPYLGPSPSTLLTSTLQVIDLILYQYYYLLNREVVENLGTRLAGRNLAQISPDFKNVKSCLSSFIKSCKSDPGRAGKKVKQLMHFTSATKYAHCLGRMYASREGFESFCPILS